jgi:hypothetical protein
MKNQKTEKVMRMKVTAPWCDDQSIEVGTYQEIIMCCISQLNYLITKGMAQDRTQDDLEGYQEVLATGSEDIAKKFFEIKDGERQKHNYLSNKEVIQRIKNEGLWDVEEILSRL